MKKFLAFLALLLLLALPTYALADDAPQDGQYTVEVTLSGGSGRASVASPAEMTVADGQATAVIVWSSPYYEFMLVDGETYYPVQKEGNSTFEIPVTLDSDIPFSAQTVAMSQPHLIEYTLRFDSDTLKPVKSGLAVTDIPIWGLLALAFILAGAALVIKRRGKRAEKG